MTADHLLAVDVVLSDGTQATFQPISLESLPDLSRDPVAGTEDDVLSRVYRSVNHIRQSYAADIQNAWPGTWRRVSGYNLNYLLPWSPATPPQWDVHTQPYPPVMPGTSISPSFWLVLKEHWLSCVMPQFAWSL